MLTPEENELAKQKLNQEVLLDVEKYDMDFNTANIMFAIVNSVYAENPIEEFEKAKMLIDRRIKMITKQIQSNNFVKRDWKGALNG